MHGERNRSGAAEREGAVGPRADLGGIWIVKPPDKPLLIFDGDCHFCRRWIERWRELTGGAVEYSPFQDVAERFPEIPREKFEESVHFIDSNGTVYRGGEAVLRSLGRKARGSIWCYEHVPGFAPITEAAYRFIARRRHFASFFTRLLWGNDVRRPTYFRTRDLFLRSVGAIYLIAFVSLWLQVDGLVGEQGVLPVGQHLQFAREQLGSDAFSFCRRFAGSIRAMFFFIFSAAQGR